MDKEGEESKE
jgi:hypothetical protein